MGWDEPPDERLRRTRVLALSHPKWVMRGVIDGLRACGVDVVEAHVDQTQAVLDHRLERSGTELTASAHTGLLHVDGGPAPETGASVTLHPGVKIRFGPEAPPEVEIEADAFET